MTTPRAVHPWQQTLPVAGSAAAAIGDDDADADRRARIALSLLVEPGDAKVGAAVQSDGAAAVAAAVARRRVPQRSATVLDEAVTAQLERAAIVGAVCLVPGSSGWPSQLDDLGDGAPVLLWVRGDSLRSDLLRSVSIVGSRACSPYGRVQAETLASELALFGWTVVSGGAYGIDAAAHNGALAVAGRTVVVSAGGVDRPYPRAHEHLYARATASGAVVSECPLGAPPAKHRFLSRNRLIAAMSRGTVVVEAALRSGARSTATAAAELSRHVMAMPGPVTSDLSRGCHEMIRDGAAVLVGGSKDVLELVTPLAENDVAAETSTRSLLGWLAAQGPSSVVEIAAEVGIDEEGTLALLTMLEGAGYATQSRRGWTMTPDAMARFARRM
jgi:DNA processing protein